MNKKSLLFMLIALMTGISMNAQQMVPFEDGDYAFKLRNDNYVYCSGFSAQGQSKSITSVSVPDVATYNGTKYYVKGVYDSAFEGTGISSVMLPTGLEFIGNNAFKDCTSLSSIRMMSVNMIANSALAGCTKLNKITLGCFYPPSYTPNSSTKTNGVTVVVPEARGIINRYKATPWNAFSTIETGISGNFVIRSYVEGQIYYGMCVHSSLPKGIVPSSKPNVEMIVVGISGNKGGRLSITTNTSNNYMNYKPVVIADSAFTERTDITSISISTIRSIGTAAFKGCTELTTVSIPCDTIGTSAFEGCSNLANITLQEGVRRILGRAFAGTAITTLNLPSTVGNNNFVVSACNDCADFAEFTVADDNTAYSAYNGLLYDKEETTIIRCPVGMRFNQWLRDVPTSCYRIGTGAFENSLAYKHDMINYYNITIPYGIKYVGNYAFSNAYRLAGITIPSTVESIGQYAFYYAGALSIDTSRPNPLSITSNTFLGSELESLQVPVGSVNNYLSAAVWKNFPVIEAGGCDYSSFGGDRGNFIVITDATETQEGTVRLVYGDNTKYLDTIPLKVHFQNKDFKVVSLGDSVFAGSKYFTLGNSSWPKNNLVIPAQINNLPRWAFEGCSALENITWEEGYEPPAMCYRAFWGTSIKEFEVPASASVIQIEAFDNCPQLEKLIFNRTSATTVYSNAYGVTNPNPNLKVYVYTNQVPRWVESVSAWSSTPTKYLNQWVNLGDHSYWPFSSRLAFKVPNELKAYIATGYTINGDKSYFKTESTQWVKSNYEKGVILVGKPNTRYLIDTDASADSHNDPVNYLKGSDKNNNFDEGETDYRYYTCTFQSDSPIEFRHMYSGVKMGRAYLEVPYNTFRNVEYAYLECYPKGDVNGDGVCNAADITALYNWILNNDNSAIVNGDQNDDDVINAGDVTTVYNIILGN